MSDQIEPLVIVERGEHAATLTLNRPAKKNAMSDDLLESVRATIEEAIAFWLPHVTINKIEVERDSVEQHQLNIILEFALTIQPTVHEVITLSFLVGE